MPQALAALPLIAEAGALAATPIIGGVTVGQVALTGTLIGLQWLMAPKPNLPRAQDGAQTLKQAIGGRIGGFGRARVAGVYALYEEKKTSYDVIALVSGRIGGFVKHYLHDDEVTINGSGDVTHATDTAKQDGRYQGYVNIQTRVGLTVETAYADIVTALPTIWTANHRGDGIASAALTCRPPRLEYFGVVYPFGLPQYSAALDLYPIWDPRDDDQDRDDSSTWEVSSNPVLQLIDYLTHSDHGMGLDYDTVIAPRIDEWMVEADYCDDLVDMVGGSQTRYTSNGWYTFDTEPKEILAAILATCDGWLAEAGDGSYALKVGVYRAPSVTITSAHVLAFSFKHGIADEQKINELTLSYTSPEHQYREAAAAAWRDEDDITAAGGVVRSRALPLTWVQNNPQARRLAKRAMARFNAPIRGTIVTTLSGLRVLGERWIGLQYPAISGLEDIVVEVQKASIDLLAGKVTIEWVKAEPEEIDGWDPEEEESNPPSEPVTPDPSPDTPPGVITDEDLAALANGILKNNAGDLEIATEGVDYWKPGGTDVAVADGGTGASTAATARSNLAAAPAAATYIVQTANSELSAEQSLGALATGIVKNTTTTGVLSIAAQGTDYYAPGGTDVAVADGGTGASTAANARTNLGLGTAATQNTGTSGANLPFLNGTNIWSGVNTYSAGVALTGLSGSAAANQLLAGADTGTASLISYGPDASTRGQFSFTIRESDGGNPLSISMDSNGTVTLPALAITTPLSVASGGTGAATLTGLLQGNGTGAFTGIANSSTVGQILRVTGAATYGWGALDLADTDAITGTLPVGNGGTGQTTLALAAGAIIPAYTGGQYPFPATQSASADANTLDDYEEGTWTPVLTFATPGNLSVAYTIQKGVYTKIGRQVTASFLILTSTFTHTSGEVGSVQITGLPFASANVSGQNAYATLAWGGITKVNYTNWVAALSANSATITFNGSGSGQAVATLAFGDMPTAGTVTLGGTLIYVT